MESRAVRAVVFDKNGKYAVLKVHGDGGIYFKIPGGAIEDNETIGQAFEREMKEEAGCKVVKLHKVGRHSFYVKEKDTTYSSICYLAKVIGQKGAASFDNWEKQRGFELLWLEKDGALKKFNDISTTNNYEKIIQKRDGDFFKKALDLKITQ